MADDTVKENLANIRRNQRRIFELDSGISTTYAELMLLLSDIDEHRLLLQRNYSSAFMGNRAIAIDNVDDLYRCRLIMIDGLTPTSEVETNFVSMMRNATRIDQLENRADLNDELREIGQKMVELNSLLQSINEIIAASNEKIVEQGDTMISDNAEWVDGLLEKRMKSATPSDNKKGVSSNADRLQKLVERSSSSDTVDQEISKKVVADTAIALEAGDGISRRRELVQADRERVVANQKRAADLLVKL